MGLSDWYKHYKDQVEKTKSVNRSAELEFVAEVNDIKPGTEWERVNKLVDFNAKHAKSTKDTTRYAHSYFNWLKKSPKRLALACMRLGYTRFSTVKVWFSKT